MSPLTPNQCADPLRKLDEVCEQARHLAEQIRAQMAQRPELIANSFPLVAANENNRRAIAARH